MRVGVLVRGEIGQLRWAKELSTSHSRIFSTGCWMSGSSVLRGRRLEEAGLQIARATLERIVQGIR